MPKNASNPTRSEYELKIKIEHSGDVVGLHHLPSEHTLEGIERVLNAGLIPELKSQEETAAGRTKHPRALLAQSVEPTQLIAAVEAGADMLVASSMLHQEEIRAAHQLARYKRKAVSIIVAIDPTTADAQEQIDHAAASGADGIKFKPAGKATERTLECINYANRQHPELLLLAAGGVKKSNRTTFSTKVGIGAETLEDIDALTQWTSKSSVYNQDIASAMTNSMLVSRQKQSGLNHCVAMYIKSSNAITRMEAIRAFAKESVIERTTMNGLFQAKPGESLSSSAFYNSLNPESKVVVAEALGCAAFTSLDDFRQAALKLSVNVELNTLASSSSRP